MHDDERAIRQLITTWLEASKAGDTAKVLSLMADDVVFLVPGRPPLRGKAEFAASQQSLAAFTIESSSEIEEIQVHGDMAWAWTRLRVAIAPREGGAANRRAGHTLSIFRKEPAGNWMLLRDANLLSPDNGG